MRGLWVGREDRCRVLGIRSKEGVWLGGEENFGIRVECLRGKLLP